MSPATGRSRPAIERTVVVLPQPDGPSSVNSLPSGTSNETSCAAFTTVPLSLAYSVYSDLTFSTAVSSGFVLGQPSPFVPAEAGTQGQRRDSHHGLWVPASAGTNGEKLANQSFTNSP